MHITAFYVGLFGLVYVALTLRVVGVRKAKHVALGDGNDPGLIRRIRAHANFAEYVPLVMILMACAESNGALPVILHPVGILFLAARLAHAYGLSQLDENFKFRIFGMMGTMASLAILSLTCIGLAIRGFWL